MLKIGHRGACGYEPENTLKSFTKAIELGVDIVEFDIHKIKSGELVVIHDDLVDRTTNGKGYVAEYDFKSIRKLDAGQGEKIPTINEVLDLVLGRCKVNIEIKGVGVAESLVKIIQERNIFDQVLVSSFRYDQLLIVKQLESKIPLAILCEEYRLDPYLDLSKDIGASDFNANYIFIDQEYVDRVHGSGLKINVFSVNKIADIKKMKDYGVDGIISNYPDRL